MACVKPDGTLTELGRQGLEALTAHANAEAASQATGIPVYRMRMLARALVDEGLMEDVAGRLQPTPIGQEKLTL